MRARSTLDDPADAADECDSGASSQADEGGGGGGPTAAAAWDGVPTRDQVKARAARLVRLDAKAAAAAAAAAAEAAAAAAAGGKRGGRR
jgi:hypothetical protein